MNKNLSILAFAVLGVASFSASAGTSTSDMTVNGTVSAACSITAPTLTLSYDPVANSSTLGTGNISVTCTNGAAYTVDIENPVSLPGSTHSMASTATPADTVNYTIYKDGTGTTAWSDTATLTGTGSGAAQSLAVSAKIDAGQTTAKVHSDYTDTVTVTVTF